MCVCVCVCVCKYWKDDALQASTIPVFLAACHAQLGFCPVCVCACARVCVCVTCCKN